MGYIIGGQFRRYGDTLLSEAAAREALRVPMVKGSTGVSIGRMQDTIARTKLAQSADISRTAPTFNDPRYTFTTLSIPTDQRTLNGLYRFFDDTDPVVGNAIRLHCLPAGEVVLTKNGIKRIEEITINDLVVNSNGQYQRVLDAFSNEYSGFLYTIKAAGCPSLTCTDEHRILTCSQIVVQTRKDSDRKEPDKKLKWKSAKDLKIGDYVVFPKYSPIIESFTIDLANYVQEISTRNQKFYEIVSDKINVLLGKKITYPRLIAVNEKFAELCGWFVAEGYVVGAGGSKHLRFALADHEKENIARIQFLLKDLFNVDSTVREQNSQHGVEIIACCSMIARMFSDLFGTGAHNKRIPDCIMNSSLEVVKSFLRAYIAGDGHESKYDYSFVTVSQTLSYQLKLLCTRLNLFFNVRIEKNQYKNPEYIARVTKRAAAEVLYNQKLTQKKHPLYTYSDDKFFYIPIRSISKTEFAGTVYDIKTEDHTFLQNFLIHNSEFPLSRISLRDCGDPVIQRHFEDMCDRINLPKLLFEIAVEYWRLGNCFPFGAWNADDYMWEQFVILNPDYVTVEGTYLNQKPFIRLQPDEHLKRIVSTGQPRELYDQLPSQIKKYVRLGQEIPLSPNNVFHLAHNKAPYENVGRSIIKRILKTLIYEDRMSMANFAIATRQVIPITVVKIGDPQTGWVPEQTEIEDVKEMFAGREVDPNFTLFYHWGINVEFYGASGKVMNLAAEFARTLKWKMIGLGISEAILSGGANYASAYAQLEVLRQRYLHFQLLLERFIHKGLFEPVARSCGFYKTRTLQSGYGGAGYKYAKEEDPADAKQHEDPISNPDYDAYIAKQASRKHAMDNDLARNYKYIYPHMDWDLMSLSNDIQYRNFLMSFDKLFPGERKISEETYYKAANLDKDAEQAKIQLEYEKRLQDDFEKAKLTKKYLKLYQKEGLTPPNYVATQGAMGLPGVGGLPSTVPGMPGPGGGAGPGGTPVTPNAPVGANPALPGGAPKPATPASSPAQAKQESIQIQQGLTQATKDKMEKEAQIIEQENVSEAAGLKLENDRMLKERQEESE